MPEGGRAARRGSDRRQEAVELHREPATLNRDAYLPDLAGSLNNLAIRLAEAGRRTDALTIGGEAANHYREVATAHTGVFAADGARVDALLTWLAENEQR
jgi:hypothetical protein